MKTFIQDGKTVAVTAPYALTSGAGCLVGSLFGVAVAAADNGAAAQIMTEGVFSIVKTSALAIAQGDTVYWDDAAKVVNKTSTGTPVGVCVVAAADPSAAVVVRLIGAFAGPVDASVLRYATVNLTNANVKALRATPIALVAAPGAGKYHEFISAQLQLDYASNVFTESGITLAVKYTDGSGAQVSDAVECTGWIDQAADTFTNAIAKKDAIVVGTGAVNRALVLHNLGGGEIAGNAGNDGVVKVHVVYRTHTA